MKRAPRAVVDTNVLVAAVIRPTGVCGHVLAAAADQRWQPVVSALLLRRVKLKRNRRSSSSTQPQAAGQAARVAESGCGAS